MVKENVIHGEKGSHQRRLIVEGLVIVASILLAFSIDAAWAQRQLRIEEREALAALEAEFSANLEQVDHIIETYLSDRARVATLRTATPAELRALSQSEVSAMMLATTNIWTFDPALGATDALVSAGRLGVLRDPLLRQALSSFTHLVADAAEDVPPLRSFIDEIWRMEAEHGGPWTDPATEVSWAGPIEDFPYLPRATADDLIRIREDARHMSLVARLHLNAAYYVGELERLRAQIVTVLDLVRSEL
jgi:hypothetical protein